MIRLLFRITLPIRFFPEFGAFSIAIIENGCPAVDFENFIYFVGSKNDDKNFKSFVLRKDYVPGVCSN